MENNMDQFSAKLMPKYARDIYDIAKPMTVKEYKGDADCQSYLTAEDALKITSKHIKETRKQTIKDLIDNLTQILNRFENADQQRRSS